MKRILGAINKYLFKDPKYFVWYCYRYFQENYRHYCHFLNDKELIQKIKDGKSLIRIGDGEIAFLHFLNIGYQKYSPALRNALLEIIEQYDERSPYILSIPLFVNDTNEKLKSLGTSEQRNYFGCWLPLKVTYELIFNKKMPYADAHIFYRDGGFEKVVLPCLKNKKVVLVTNTKSRSDVEEHHFSKEVYKYIISPERDAFEDTDRIKTEIRQTIETSGFGKGDFIILMSAGLSKLAIYDLSKEGYQMLDVGRGIESYYKKESLQHLI